MTPDNRPKPTRKQRASRKHDRPDLERILREAMGAVAEAMVPDE